MCEYVGSLIKCNKLLKAEAFVVNSCDDHEIKCAINFIQTHISEVMHESPLSNCYIHKTVRYSKF